MKQTLNILRGWSWLMLLALLAGCSNDSDEPEPPQPENPKQSFPLTIEVAENPMIIDGAENDKSTRAAITTSSSLEKFYMSYVFANTQSTTIETATITTEGKWTGGTWPNAAATNDDMVDWYAYTGGTFGRTEDAEKKPYINFVVEEAADHQHDLLVATAANKYSLCSGYLRFTFDHACSALRFYVKKAKNLNGHTLRISSIVLKNVVKHGKYFYEIGDRPSEWTPITTNPSDDITNYTLYTGSEITLGSETTDYVALNGNFGSASEPYLFVIPQELTAWNPTETLGNTYLELTCSIDGAASQTAYIPFGTTFEKGTQHDVKINIGKNSLYKSNGALVIE